MASVKLPKKRYIRRGGPELEDASNLNLGEEFTNAQCLYLSEVKVILDVQDSKGIEVQNRASNNAVLAKTLEYVRNFSRYNTIDSVREVRQVMQKGTMTHYEVAQMANLCCEEAEEAKALIPSVSSKYDDEEIQVMLNQMQQIRKFQG
ncbi:HRDC-like protein [Sporodiniella umbellata]|nr:HRDC-like protein [Sporodiniella umbellata]